ncbi:MAG: Nre family DNA repair protein [Candidatus Micrarchaeia archaeon]
MPYDETIPELKHSSVVYKNMKDPELLRLYYKMNSLKAENIMEAAGSSPTDIFIGRYNYPKVYIGPLSPLEFGDTSLLATPEKWRSLSIPEIINMRTKLVRGLYLSNIYNVEKGKIEEQIRDLALAEKPADIEMYFKSKPHFIPSNNDDVQPFGPSAAIRNVELHNIKADKKIERSYYDTDAKAATSIVELYNRGLPISKIDIALSAGLLGIKKYRKFVPTRWSITATDDIISKSNLQEVKENESIDAIYAYFHVSLDNRWLIFFIPGSWQYESAEAWYPHTIWNMEGSSINIEASYENYNGRNTYAEIGGCYYAARVAVTEKLKEIKKQAVVLILREVHEGYLLPVGVWNVREHVRETLATTPTVMHSVNDMLNYIDEKMEIKHKGWISNTHLLRILTMQKRLDSYVKT